MQYNFHNMKIKDDGSISRISKEAFREYKEDTYKNNVRKEDSYLNVYYEFFDNSSNWYQQAKLAKERQESETGRAVRKDAVVLCSTVESLPPWGDIEASNQYFIDKAHWYEGWLKQNTGMDDNCMLSCVIHNDEGVADEDGKLLREYPHATYVWMPIKDGKFSCKSMLDRNTLHQLQVESQEFTFNWIENYNATHERQLEKLDPILEGSKKKNLDIQNYKIQMTSQMLNDLEDQTIIAKQELRETQEAIGNLVKDKVELESLKVDYVQKANELEKITNAPSVESYVEAVNKNESLTKENINLKQELSFKDKVINQLKEETNKLKNTIDDFREKFSRLGSKLATSLGFEPSDKMNEFPSKEISNTIAEVFTDLKTYNPKDMRVLPSGEDDKFKIVVKDGHDFKTIKEFTTREDAENYRRNFDQSRKEIIDDKLDDNLKLK